MPYPVAEIRDLRSQRVKLIEEAQEINDKSIEEKRDLTEDEQDRYDQKMEQAEKIRRRYDRMEQLNEAERSQGTASGPSADPNDPERDIDPAGGEIAEIRSRQDLVELHGRSLDLRESVSDAERRAMAVYASAFRKVISGNREQLTEAETRTLQSTIESAGGALVVPVQMATEILKDLEDRVTVRRLAHKTQLPTAISLGVIKKKKTADDAEWTPEIGAIKKGDDPTFEGRAIEPHLLAKYGDCSFKLARVSSGSAMTMLRDDLNSKTERAEENAFCNGDGNNKPLGVFVPSEFGLSTDRDLTIDFTDGTTIFDDLMDAKWGIRQEYHGGCTWLADQQFFQRVAKARYPDGRPVWTQSDKPNTPDRLLSMETAVSDFAPADFVACRAEA